MDIVATIGKENLSLVFHDYCRRRDKNGYWLVLYYTLKSINYITIANLREKMIHACISLNVSGSNHFEFVMEIGGRIKFSW